MTKIHTSGNGNPSNFHVMVGTGLPVALPTQVEFSEIVAKVIMT